MRQVIYYQMKKRKNLNKYSKMALTNAIRILSFWASCFDYKNYTSKKPMYGGEQGCRDAERLLEDFVDNKNDPA